MTNLPQGWEVKKLGDIAEIQIGKTPSRNNIDFFQGENIWLSIRDLKSKFVSSSSEKISNEAISKTNMKVVPKGTLLMSFKLTLGKTAFAECDLYTNEAIAAIFIKNKNINKYFLDYVLKFTDLEKYVDNAVKGKTLNKQKLKQIEILLPKNIKEQERIVGILDESFAKIDESIKILEQNLLNLDELMQSALQKAFNPLKDNAKENYKLPQSWEWKSLEEISENISAGGDKPKNCTESKTAKNQIPVYANGVNNNGLVGYTDKATIIKPSLTISARGTIGFVCIRKEPYFPIVRLISLIPCENILCLHYLYFCLNFFIAKGEGSSIPQLTIPKFKSLQIPLPPLKEQEQIAKHLDFVFEKTKALKELYTKELKDYEELKQSLLNKAFKGEL
ncbi:restriction endonuclease subunit S [Campylobacter coli]|uniref:restriction endonuclease subunit S n=1 Tax=Campylobacter coli TaxID=195 RepID=UPI00087494A2|nr:restriction endonuclease subunit S [Campylobacter coli]EAH6040237.1 restriction endonuclease subunit S [Campylobacter coli]EAI4488520.1 restriction endonuclease subunit S [Campylobacter coli]EAI8943638.1 restriction endonuclease subunit S [Campylobacter coli]EAI8953671.1 restriction endonuclease subunit S [Campylobacter coli]EAJ3141279.1 restriction endonuclease subunit S [Campylobacter coli]